MCGDVFVFVCTKCKIKMLSANADDRWNTHRKCGNGIRREKESERRLKRLATQSISTLDGDSQIVARANPIYTIAIQCARSQQALLPWHTLSHSGLMARHL